MLLRSRLHAFAGRKVLLRHNAIGEAVNRRNEKKALSAATSFFPFRLLLWGLKGASSPFLVAGRGVSRGREGGVEPPLSPSGPAERPRRRCILQKASDLPYAATLCAGKDDLELPPLRSGNRSGRIIFYSRLSRSAERSKRIFTGGAVPVNCIGYRNCILRGVLSPQISGQSTAFCV